MNYSKTKRKQIDRSAVVRSLRDLELLFGRKTPDRNGSTAGKSGAGVAGNLIKGVAK